MENIILDNIDDGVYVSDPDTFALLYVNKKLASERGLENAGGFAQSPGAECWRVLYPGKDVPCSHCPREKLLAEPDEPVYWESYDAGAGKHYRFTARLVKLSDGRRVQLVQSCDITAMKERLDRIENNKNDYMSRMSHEILTPMNAIVGMSKIAGATDDLAKIKNCLFKIDEASKQLLGIINSIIDISRLEADKLQLVFDDVRLEQIMIEACTETMARANEKGQDFKVLVNRDVPAVFRSDGQRLYEVLLHILLNAVKFTPIGGKIDLRVSLKSRVSQRADIEFAVADNGVGISPEYKERLFDAFEQANGTRTRKHGGIGLGLAIARRLVRLLGGDIAVESEPGAGSTFVFNIVAEAAGGEPEHALIQKPAGVDINILYADSNEDAREYFGTLMGEYRTPYKCVEDGFAALTSIEKAIAAHMPYTIAFIDLRMPHLNGIETIRQIRQKFGKQPTAVLMAGVEWNMIEQTAAEAGIGYFLSKPLFPSKIIDIVNQITGKPQKRRAGGEEAATPDFSAKRLLLVDDVKINGEIIAAYLEPTGAVLDYAGSGREAVSMFFDNKNAYDMILLDLHMPDMDGCETAISVRSLEKSGKGRVPILALTAEIFEKDIARCRQAGMDGFIQKPVSEEQLYERLGAFFFKNDAAEGWTGPEGGENSRDAYDEYLPVFNVEAALKKLKNIKKLYVAMLLTLKNNVLFGKLHDALVNEDFIQMDAASHSLAIVAQNLFLDEMLVVLKQIEAMAKHGVARPELLDMYEAARGNIAGRLDDLMTALSAEADR